MKKTVIAILGAAALFAAGAVLAQSKAGKPNTVIHVVTLYWKADASAAQREAALAAVDKLPATYPGIKNVWTKTISKQGEIGGKPIEQVIVMEFADQAALKTYRDSVAQKEFYKAYLPARGESRTHDVTN